MTASLRILLSALISGLLMGSAWAATDSPSLKSDHPSRYIVQKGDTLWDISGRFLDEPWRWPDVWQANPQIKNPHLIYPGDEVILSYKDGRPIIRVRRRGKRGVVYLSPTVRRESLAEDAIPTIPVDAIQQFLARPRVVTEEEFEASPYILSVGKEALSARPDAKIYVRGITSDKSTRYSIYRRGRPYENPAKPGEILGMEAIHVGDAVLERAGDPATLLVTAVKREVLTGDRLVAVDRDEPYQAYMPRPPARDLSGQIISVFDGVSQIGQFQTVVINLGARDGLEPGHVFAVYQAGETVEDPLARESDPEMAKFEARARERAARIENDTPQAFLQGLGNAVEAGADLIAREFRRFEVATTGERPWAEVTLPRERAGTILVYRPFERLSYGLVMEATRAMHVNDPIKNP